jgi:hypothetical protein
VKLPKVRIDRPLHWGNHSLLGEGSKSNGKVRKVFVAG